jgi:hypothetical protein
MRAAGINAGLMQDGWPVAWSPQRKPPSVQNPSHAPTLAPTHPNQLNSTPGSGRSHILVASTALPPRAIADKLEIEPSRETSPRPAPFHSSALPNPISTPCLGAVRWRQIVPIG